MLRDRTALITGASGIAAATAELFTEHGAKVVVIDRSRDNLRTLKDGLPDVLTLEGDLTDSETCKELVAKAQETLGRIDSLVNVVGISGRRFGDGAVHEATDEGFDTVLTTNLKPPSSCVREVLRHMLPRKTGSIVNTASVLAYAPNGEHFGTHAYAARRAR